MTKAPWFNPQKLGCIQSLVAVAAIVLAAMFLSWLTHDKPPPIAAAVALPQPAGTQERAEARPTDRPSHILRAEDFGDDWPLTVPAAVVTCIGNRELPALILSVGSRRYALNGTAKARDVVESYNLHDIKEIWRQNPADPSLRVYIGPLIERARSACQD